MRSVAPEKRLMREGRCYRIGERDARHRSRLTAIYMFCLACTSLFRNMKLNVIAQSGSPPNVLHSPSINELNGTNSLPCLNGIAGCKSLAYIAIEPHTK